MERTTAVFHQPDRMEEALRDLADRGIAQDHEIVPPEAIAPSHPPHSFFGLPHRLHYAGLGAAVGMFAGLSVGGGNTLVTIWLVIAGAVFGSFIGGLVGLAIGGIKKQLWLQRAPEQRWLVRVDTASRDDADRAELTLRSYGADIMQPS